MANSNNIGTDIVTSNPQIIANGYTLPSGFNDLRQPGELANLFDANSNIIYDKFTAKTGYTGLLRFGPRQPFIYVSPNDANKGINALKKYESRAVPLGSALQDVERIAKWSITGDGIIFLAKQFFLQGQNAFNETKIYNPLTPALAVSSIASFGVIPTPTRFIDVSSIGGFVSSLGFGASDQAPSTTVGKQAVSDVAKKVSNPYKGLLRGASTTLPSKALAQRWQGGKPSGGIIGNYFKDGFNRIFGGLIPQSQPQNTKYRADEGTYGIMLGSKDVLKSYTSIGAELSWGKESYQRWEAGSNNDGPTEAIKKTQQTSITDSKKLINIFGQTIPSTSQYFGIAIGYTLQTNQYGYKTYGDNVGIIPITKNNSGLASYEYSDLLSIYKKYTAIGGTIEANNPVKQNNKFNDKNTDSVKKIQENLQKVIDKIKNAGYAYEPTNSEDKLVQQFSSEQYIGIDNVTYLTKDPFSEDKGVTANNYNNSYMRNFRFNKAKQLLDDPSGKGMATTNQADKINLLDVSKLDSQTITDSNPDRPYDSYRDDQIAFFFYDIVNDKYIPFRATVKGLSESLTGEWNDVSYIGRADKLYTYKGFSRTLSFNFTVHVNSIKELLPTWKKINYFCGLVKPANYTGNQNYPTFSRFIIPPLIKFTIGDLYKNQPSVITSIGLSIPEDAIWETLGEDGGNNYTNNDQDWNYLAGKFVWKSSKGKYAQFPKTADLSVNLNILEKEKPITGGSQFGDVYRDIDFNNMVSAGDFSKGLIVTNK